MAMQQTGDTEPTGTKKRHLVWIILGAAVLIAVIIGLTFALNSGPPGPTLADNVSILQGKVAALDANYTSMTSNLVNIAIKQSEIASNFSNIFALVSAIPNWSPTIEEIQQSLTYFGAILANYTAIHTSVLNPTHLRATIFGAGNFTPVITAWGNWSAPSVSLLPGSANCTISDWYLSDNFVTIFINPIDNFENLSIIDIMIEDSTGSIDYASASIGGSL